MTELFKIRKRITITWLICAAILLIFVIALVLNHPDLTKVAGSWYSTSIMPSTGVIIGLWLAVSHTGTTNKHVNSMSAGLAEAFLYFYIFCLIMPFVVFVGYKQLSFEAYFEISQMWLALLQTPTLALLGKIFADNTEPTSNT
ncbi:hypothetical protein [Alteromonas sp. BZK5]|uniref:hypothetical protein n=1 Tax=Alteromonas sp. BZK5 TaxID=1904459 RepID=UPI00165364CF|nr:hypothetical protein [Alteromonas sp. BZK5]MBC6987715.1 hypothetical protein [Alteromonas sp. BZK5]